MSDNYWSTDSAIKRKIDGIFELTLGVVDLVRRYSPDEAVLYIYDRRTNEELFAGSAKKVLGSLAEMETSILYLKKLNYTIGYHKK